MDERRDGRDQAVERLDAAREARTRCFEEYDVARGSPRELPAFTELRAAEEQFAAREAWLAWVDSDD